MQVLAHNFVFPPQELYPECHASTVVKASDGTIIAAWFGGTHEKHDDVAIWSSRYVNGAWEPQRIIANTRDIPCWNPVLFNAGDRLILFFKSGKEIPAWQTLYSESFDNGKTWTAPKELVEGDIGGRGPVKNKPIRLHNGTILAPSSVETETSWDCFTDRSDDNGKTWTRSPFVPIPHDQLHGRGIIQPSLWEELSDNVIHPHSLTADPHSSTADPHGFAAGKTSRRATGSTSVHMLMRSTEGSIYTASSLDGGLTWNEAQATNLPNNNSGLDMTRTDNGDLYLVCNPVGKDWGARTPIVLLRSKDNGANWEEVMTLDHIPCDTNQKAAEFSYPAIIAVSNTNGSELHITYTWKRQTIAYWHLLCEN